MSTWAMANCERRVPMLTTFGSCMDVIVGFDFECMLVRCDLSILVEEMSRC